ncbi:hypothetical protein [Propionivibrio sp.]|uniref:hypothetical protein n=1 Tax=Propionivibrio sp. TaxID=2212460 RepID=UPI003BF06CC7
MADYFNPFAKEESTGTSSEYFNPFAEQPKPQAIGTPSPEKSSLARRALGDTGISLLKGAIAIPEAAVGLADIATGGYAGKAAEQIGFRPKEAKAILEDYLSPEQKSANAYVQGADGFVDTIGRAIERPSVIGQTIAESLPLSLGGGIVGRGVAAVTKAVPWAAGAIGEGLVGAGSAAEGLRQDSEDGTISGKQVGASLASGAGTALFGAAGGKFAQSKIGQKLGIGDLETTIAGGPNQAVGKGFAGRVAGGAVSEGVLEELPQSAWEQAMQNYATDKPLDEGVGKAAAMGLLSGSVMGAGFNALPQGKYPIDPPPELTPEEIAMNASQANDAAAANAAASANAAGGTGNTTTPGSSPGGGAGSNAASTGDTGIGAGLPGQDATTIDASTTGATAADQAIAGGIDNISTAPPERGVVDLDGNIVKVDKNAGTLSSALNKIAIDLPPSIDTAPTPETADSIFSQIAELEMIGETEGGLPPDQEAKMQSLLAQYDKLSSASAPEIALQTIQGNENGQGQTPGETTQEVLTPSAPGTPGSDTNIIPQAIGTLPHEPQTLKEKQAETQGSQQPAAPVTQPVLTNDDRIAIAQQAKEADPVAPSEFKNLVTGGTVQGTFSDAFKDIHQEGADAAVNYWNTDRQTRGATGGQKTATIKGEPVLKGSKIHEQWSLGFHQKLNELAATLGTNDFAPAPVAPVTPLASQINGSGGG